MALAAHTAGKALGLFGLPGVALGLAVVLIVLATTLWRRAAVGLALVATALATGGATNYDASGLNRIDRSSGLMVSAPVDSAAAEKQELVRGFGSVLVDLRDTRMSTTSPTKIVARSDTGRVVVALPRNRCVNVRLRGLTIRSESAGDNYRETVDAAIRAGWLPAGEHSRTQNWFFNPVHGHPRILPTGLPGYSGSAVILFGWRISSPPDSDFVTTQRKSSDPNAPWIDLDLTAANEIIVRDYPAGDEVLGNASVSDPLSPDPEGSPSGVPALVTATIRRQATYPQLENADWPARYSLSPPDGDKWTEWRQQKIASSVYRSQLAAGNCATRKALRNHFSEIPSGPREGRRVNALGELENGGQP